LSQPPSHGPTQILHLPASISLITPTPQPLPNPNPNLLPRRPRSAQRRAAPREEKKEERLAARPPTVDSTPLFSAFSATPAREKTPPSAISNNVVLIFIRLDWRWGLRGPSPPSARAPGEEGEEH
uniref:Uncharacterized protein n=1 Tax=Oryza rufipogon TaxID=4529 RepID=A0A0E0QDG7_ORYRU